MNFKPPAAKAVKKAFPGLEDVKFLAQGGFKAVYDCRIKGERQAFKLSFIPPVADPGNEDEVAAHGEVLGRAKRELNLLAKLKRPEIVKLGRMKPRNGSRCWRRRRSSATPPRR